MIKEPLISVIVPVYNAEEYLEKCVNSIINQTYKNLEIILVDDGSPDKSGEMCDAFAVKDLRVRVIHKENGGQSSARNRGLDIMKGELVGFVDSDDWIEPDMYQHLYEMMIQFDAQIACCGVQKDYPNGKVEFFNIYYPGDNEIRIYSRAEALRESLANVRITYSPCDKLYHKDVFANLRMTEGIIYEDMEIIPKWIERTETVAYNPTPKYHYTMTDESTIRGTYNLRRMAEVDVALAKAKDYQTRYPELYDEAMGRYIAVCLYVIHASHGVPECKSRRKELISVLRGRLSKAAVATLGKGERIKLFALRISVTIYELLMSVYDMIK